MHGALHSSAIAHATGALRCVFPARLLADFHDSARAVLMKDEVLFERALAEYRESTADLQDFADLPIEVQSEILRRGHHIKTDLEREKRG